MSPSEKPQIEFPCSYHLRVIVIQHPEAKKLLTELVLRHVPAEDFHGMTATSSRTGKYTAYVIYLLAANKQQMEALYRELNQHELVKMSL